MDITYVYSKRQTRSVLRALRRRGITVTANVVESAVLPTSELLLLVQESENNYSLHLLGGSQILSAMVIEENIDRGAATLIIPQVASTLMGKNTVINFNPDRSGVRQGLRNLTAVN